MTTTLLPTQFADLEPFASTWCLPSEDERYERRLGSTMAEMQQFYDAITARAEDVLCYCDTFPFDDLPEQVENLLYLLYSMITVSFPVEVWSQPKIPDTGVAALDCVVEPVP